MEALKINTLETETEYKEALKKLNPVWEAKPNTEEGKKLELLVSAIEKYETKHFSF